MKRRISSLFAGLCTILLAAGFTVTFALAWKKGITAGINSLVGFFLSIALAPIFHELGHVIFAKIANMETVYVKCFCFKISVKNGKRRFSFASPFAPDQTQTIPKKGGNMQSRAGLYTLGGMIVEGITLIVVVTLALLWSITGFKNVAFLFWGLVPYMAYLFLFNLAPAEYPLGKTDMAIYLGIKRGGDVEKNMLSAMEIQGELYEGKSYAQIPKDLYFDTPQLREDEPLFLIMLDLRYRYFLETDDMKNATVALNRLAQLQGYLSDEEVENVAAELVYLHSIRGELDLAEESSKLCRNLLMQDTLTAKRILLAFSLASGTTDAIEPLQRQAKKAAKTERILGVRKFEEKLISRILQA